jgi:aspartyl-tRNA synthetase
MFVHIFEGLDKRFAKELKIVSDQYPFEPFLCKNVRLSFKEGVKLLADNGYT